MQWHERLKQERQSRQWTQRMLAEKIGTAKRTIMRWENGHAFPHPYYRDKLTALFGSNFQERDLPQDIVTGDHHPPEQVPSPPDAEPVLHQYNGSLPLLIAPPQSVTYLVQDDQVHQQRRYWATDHLFSSDIHPPMKRSSILRPFHRFSRRPALIGLIILLTILLISTMLSRTLIGQTSHTSTSVQVKHGPTSTLLPEQLYKTLTSQKPLYQSSFFHVQEPKIGAAEYSSIPGLSLSDFALQADISTVHGDGGAGFSFRIQSETDPLWEYALIYPEGKWGLGGRTFWFSEHSSAIKQGLNQTNRLSIVAQKHMIYLYINGQFITQVNDRASSENSSLCHLYESWCVSGVWPFSSHGSVGPVVATYGNTQSTDVLFEKVQVF